MDNKKQLWNEISSSQLIVYEAFEESFIMSVIDDRIERGQPDELVQFLHKYKC